MENPPGRSQPRKNQHKISGNAGAQKDGGVPRAGTSQFRSPLAQAEWVGCSQGGAGVLDNVTTGAGVLGSKVSLVMGPTGQPVSPCHAIHHLKGKKHPVSCLDLPW